MFERRMELTILERWFAGADGKTTEAAEEAEPAPAKKSPTRPVRSRFQRPANAGPKKDPLDVEFAFDPDVKASPSVLVRE